MRESRREVFAGASMPECKRTAPRVPAAAVAATGGASVSPRSRQTVARAIDRARLIRWSGRTFVARARRPPVRQAAPTAWTIPRTGVSGRAASRRGGSGMSTRRSDARPYQASATCGVGRTSGSRIDVMINREQDHGRARTIEAKTVTIDAMAWRHVRRR